jgi:hypothetical protein
LRREAIHYDFKKTGAAFSVWIGIKALGLETWQKSLLKCGANKGSSLRGIWWKR